MSELGTVAGKTDLHSALGHSAVAQVCAHWSALRADGKLPRRSDINPKDFGAALPDVFLAELVTPRVARLRICGHRVEDLMGMDMRGMPLSVLFDGKARAAVTEAVEQAGMGARVMLSLESVGSFSHKPLRATLALLPLADDTGRVTRILGVIDQQGEVGRTPRSFTLAEPVVEAKPERPVVAKRPALRVITGGRA